MLKRTTLASIAAGLVLGAPFASADPQWFYPGHGWSAQPPLVQTAPEERIRVAGKIPAPSVSESTTPEAPARFCEPSGSTHPERLLESCGY